MPIHIGSDGKYPKIYHATATKPGSSEAKHQQPVTHLCPLRGQGVWDRAVCGVCFFLARMEPQDMINWRNHTNNLPDFINNYILQRDNVRVEEKPPKPGRAGLQKPAHKCPWNFLLQLHFLWFSGVTALSKGSPPMNSWTTKQALHAVDTLMEDRYVKKVKKSDDEHLPLA